MAIFTVTTTDDSGAGSLRQAILDANADADPGSTIVFDAGITNQTITLVSELPLVLAADTVIDGGANNITIDGPGTGFQVIFTGDTGSGASTTFEVTSGERTIAGNDPLYLLASGIAGDGAITKTGAGELVLSGDNTNYSGSFTLGSSILDGGTLRVANSQALGTGVLTVAAFGSVVDYADLVAIANNVIVEGDGIELHVDSGATATQAGEISGDGDYIKTGDGTLVLSGNNLTATCEVVLAEGTLRLENDNALGLDALALAVGSSGTVVDYANNITIENFLVADSDDTDLNVTLGTARQSGEIIGSSNLTKTGAGTLVLAGDNSGYFGDITLAGGTLRLEHDNALGDAVDSVLTTTGSVIDYADTVVINNPIVLDSNDTKLNVDLGDTAEQAGAISQVPGPLARPLEKIGGGTLILSGENSYTGKTTIRAGTLVLDPTDLTLLQASSFNVKTGAFLAIGDGVLAEIDALEGAGTVVLGDFARLSVLVDDGEDTVFSGSITDTTPDGGDFEKVGDGKLTLTGTSSIRGELSLCGCLGDDNVLEISGINASFTADLGTIIDDGKLTVTKGGELTTGILEVSGLSPFGGTLLVDKGSKVTAGLLIADGAVTVDGALSEVTAEFGTVIGGFNLASLTISNGGTFTSEDFATVVSDGGSATALVTGAGSKWDINGALLIGDDTGLGLVGDVTVADGGVINAVEIFVGAGSSLALGNGELAGTLHAQTIENLGDIVAFFTNTRTLSADISGDGDLTKAGAGRLTLTGDSSYTGATTVKEGVLRVNGTLTDSLVTVEDGGTLGGTGTTSAVVIEDGGTLAAGASAGILATGNLSFAAGGILAAELGGSGAGQFDRVKVTGTVSLDDATLAVSLLGAFKPATGTSFAIIRNDGNDAIVGTFAGLAQGAKLATAGGSYSISYIGGSGNDVVLTALNDAPVITSNGGGATAAVSVKENTRAVTKVRATDPDSGNLRFSIAGGADAARFKINANTGALAFKEAPDFENPGDAGGNNTYTVVVRASDGALSDTQKITVTVTNVDGVTITGTGGNDVVSSSRTVPGEPLPTGEEDIVRGEGGNDRLGGLRGNDRVVGANGDDQLLGGAGNDWLRGGNGKDDLDGGRGSDTAYYQDRAGPVSVVLGGAAQVLVRVGGVVEDTLKAVENLVGSRFGDKLVGDDRANRFEGGGGNDILKGALGDDLLVGGTGRDVMTGGGGADDFRFKSVAEMGKTAATRDLITDFRHGVDVIDLSAIDANGSAAGHRFIFLATEGEAFNHVRGELRWFQVDAAGAANDKTIVAGDINGDGKADFQIELAGLKTLTEGDFLL